VIADFGLATESTNENFLFAKCGTPGYVAPEILKITNSTETYTDACDIFSCGVIFYEL
jgi:serine/threonine protein kinase